MWRSLSSEFQLLVIGATALLCLVSTVGCIDNEDVLLDHTAGDLILLPVDPIVEDGHWLTLNCTILPHYKGRFTNRDLYFRHANVNFTNLTLVGSKTALLKLQWNLTENEVNGGHIKCLLPDSVFVPFATQHITVVRRPLEPNVTDCFLWNWKLVNCTWLPSLYQQQEHMHTHSELIQTLQWKLQDDVNDMWQDAACQGKVNTSCAWNVSHVVNRFMKSENCCVHVLGRIKLNELHFDVQSASFCFHPVHVVVIDKPRNVTVINADSRRVLVQWQAPVLDWNHVSSTDLVYTVIVMSQWSDMAVLNRTVMDQSILVNSTPHTRYDVTVKAKTVESQPQFWSKPAVRDFTTAPAEPKMSPPSLSNAFTVSHVDKDTRTVIVYWQTLQVQDYYGESLRYIVSERRPPEPHWNELRSVRSADLPFAEVIVDSNIDVELTVTARNEVGDSLRDVVINLPAVRSPQMTISPFVELAVELTNDSTVVWSWRLKSSLEHAGRLTLFWCKSRVPLGRCADDIQWREVAASESEYNLTIDAGDVRHHNYGAALSADSGYGGIKWVSCLYNVNGLAAPVENVRASAPSFGDPGQLLVTWIHPACDVDYQHGYIKSLRLYYCRHADTECVDPPSIVPLPGYQTAYNLTGLEPGAEYGVWMYSWTGAGRSLTHSNVTVAVASLSVMTPAVIAGISIGLIVFLFLTFVVFWLLCRKYCRRCRDKLFAPVVISVPQPVPQPSRTSAAADMPMVEYSRISYARQGSRLSSSSRDSGQFGVASGSPLMGSGSECAELSPATPNNHVEQRHQPHLSDARPAAATYVNDEVVVLRHPTANNRHRPPSSPTDPECVPLQPMTDVSRFPPDDDAHVSHVTESLMSWMNGVHDTGALQSGYVPHKWMQKM